MRLDESAIDHTQWLPKSFRDEYPHQAKRLSISKQHNTYQARNSLLPIDLLLDLGIITDEQNHAGKIVSGLRRSIRYGLGIDRKVIENPVTIEIDDYGMGPTVMLNLLLRGLNKWQLELVEHVTSLPKDTAIKNNYEKIIYFKWLSLCIESMRDGLDNINKNLDKIENNAESGVSVKG